MDPGLLIFRALGSHLFLLLWGCLRLVWHGLGFATTWILKEEAETYGGEKSSSISNKQKQSLGKCKPFPDSSFFLCYNSLLEVLIKFQSTLCDSETTLICGSSQVLWLLHLPFFPPPCNHLATPHFPQRRVTIVVSIRYWARSLQREERLE